MLSYPSPYLLESSTRRPSMFMKHILHRFGAFAPSSGAYTRHLWKQLWKYRGNRPLAYAKAIGAESIAEFDRQGDGQVEVLLAHGLRNGMAIYDLGCGSGRTAQALARSGWHGQYAGADVVAGLLSEVKRTCPGYATHLQREARIVAADESLDMIFHWSVFTHISPEDCYLYLEDSFRALRSGGKVVFSFLEFADRHHWRVFESRLRRRRAGRQLALVDTFLHRDWIVDWAKEIGFTSDGFTDGQDSARHAPMWQTVVELAKP